jgi:5,10-methylenetetrahydromethanopterin reductase
LKPLRFGRTLSPVPVRKTHNRGARVNPTLSVLLFSEYPMAKLIELGQLVEELGYWGLWYTDVRFARDCFIGLAAIAARTAKIRLGTGVCDPYSRHPSATAAAIATLDEMSGGRAVLGLGTGGQGLRELGIEQKLPVAAMREAVQMVRGLLRGETVTAEGKVVSLASGRLDFSPPRRDVPIYFATHGAQVTRLAGQIADGVLIANTLNPKAFDFYLAQLADGMAKAERPDGSVDIGLRVEACIAEDDDAAFAVMRRRVASRVVGQYPHWEYLDALGLQLPEAFVEIAKRPDAKKAADEAAAVMPRAIVESMVLAGNPESCAQQLAKGLGPKITHVTLRPHAAPGDDVTTVIRDFIEKVVPRALEIRGVASSP